MGWRLLVLAAAWALLAAPASAAPEPAPYGTDNVLESFRDVLPPGANGLTNGPELALFLSAGQRPAHNDDQLPLYRDLMYATPGLRAEDVPKYFKDATFGVQPDDVARRYSPREDVTIVRDKGFGVPHVYGATRDGAMFGLGYVAAEDRLFFIDILRHLGRAEVTTFAGGAAGNRALDEEQWRIAPYTEADLQRQVDQLDDQLGTDGAEVQRDLASYVAGINAYIAEAKLNPSKMPGEYAAINKPGGPDPWKATDVIATASLVGGIFGKGGGLELTQAKLLQSFRGRFGQRLGGRLWREWAAFEDPDSPTTVRDKVFRYQRTPRRSVTGRLAVLPDPDSVREAPLATGETAPGERSGGGLFPRAFLDGAFKMSNALVVSAARSTTGHPLAVFGPQTGYFSPQILMEQDVHAPGLDARGAAFPGVNLYVQLGHGRDYAWSATSAGQDIIDTYALPLCQDDNHYEFRGQCVAMETLSKTNAWTPSAADQTPPGSETLVAQRTKLGIVTARGTVGGRRVAFTNLRSTYMHEVDSAPGFSDFNNPAKVRDARSWQQAAAKIGYTFNWLYVDDHDVAYFNSGNNPLRPTGVTGQLPLSPRAEWNGFDPDTLRARYTPFAQHPQLVNGQDFITSWNNKQARGYAGADSNLFSSVYRSDMLDQEIRARLAGGRKLTLPGLIDAMEEAGTTDLRGERVLPLALRVLAGSRNAQVRAAAAKLSAWVARGAHRVDRDRNGAYDDADAVQIMDAWWPLWLRAQFEPVLGQDLFDALSDAKKYDNDPNNHGDHLGSAYQDGWYGYAYKDLRTVLKRRVKAPYGRRYCGRGVLARCRAVLESSLLEALALPRDQVYPSDARCPTAGDQVCRDKVLFRPLGGATQPLIPWINRPTYQQAVEVKARLPRR